MTIGKRIILGFTASVALTAALGIFAYSQIGQIGRLSAVIVADCLPRAALSGTFDGWARQQFTIVQRHVLNEDPAASRQIEDDLSLAQFRQRRQGHPILQPCRKVIFQPAMQHTCRQRVACPEPIDDPGGMCRFLQPGISIP